MHKILEKTFKFASTIFLSIFCIPSIQGMEVKDTSPQLIDQTSDLLFILYQNNPLSGEVSELIDRFQELKSMHQRDVTNLQNIAEISYGYHTFYDPVMSQEDFEKENEHAQLTYEDYCEQYQKQCDEIDVQDEIRTIEANIQSSIREEESRNKAREKIDISKKNFYDFCLEVLKTYPKVECGPLLNHPFLGSYFKHIPEMWFFIKQMGQINYDEFLIPQDIIVRIFQEVFKLELSKIQIKPPKKFILDQLLINKEDNQRVFSMDGLILEIPVQSNELLVREKYALKNDKNYIQSITLGAYPGNYCAKYILDRYRNGRVEILSFLSVNGKKLNLVSGVTYKLSADKKYFSVHKTWQS